MSEPINLALLSVGTKLVLSSGDIVEVVDNPQDGMWVICRRLQPDGTPVPDGKDEAVYALDVEEIAP